MGLHGFMPASPWAISLIRLLSSRSNQSPAFWACLSTTLSPFGLNAPGSVAVFHSFDKTWVSIVQVDFHPNPGGFSIETH
jgi:hypothetical protein